MKAALITTIAIALISLGLFFVVWRNERARRSVIAREQPITQAWARGCGHTIEPHPAGDALWVIYNPKWILQYDWRMSTLSFQSLTQGPDWVLAHKDERMQEARTAVLVRDEPAQSTGLLDGATVLHGASRQAAGLTEETLRLIHDWHAQSPEDRAALAHIKAWRLDDTFFIFLAGIKPTSENVKKLALLGNTWQQELSAVSGTGGASGAR